LGLISREEKDEKKVEDAEHLKLKLAIFTESFHSRPPVNENSVKTQDRYFPLCG
jgi:hypothetical protein